MASKFAALNIAACAKNDTSFSKKERNITYDVIVDI